MKNDEIKLRKKSFTLVEQVCHEVLGFRKLYQDLEEKNVLSGQSKSTLNNPACRQAGMRASWHN